MSDLDTDEQELFDFGMGAVPDWYDDGTNEFAYAAAKIFGSCKRLARDMLTRQTRILLADGPTSTTPDFLGAHARDRGSFRQLTEGNDALRARLHTMPEAAVVPSALVSATAAVLAIADIVDAPALVELPRDESFPGPLTSQTGTGGTFAAVTGGMTFTPTVGFSTWPRTGWNLIISGASSSGNNGTFPVTGVLVNGAAYSNGSGVAGADAGASWTLQKTDAGGVADGFERVYVDRGYRLGVTIPTVVMILPYGTTDAVGRSAAEALRQKRAAGVRVVVERRLVP